MQISPPWLVGVWLVCDVYYFSLTYCDILHIALKQVFEPGSIMSKRNVWIYSIFIVQRLDE